MDKSKIKLDDKNLSEYLLNGTLKLNNGTIQDPTETVFIPSGKGRGQLESSGPKILAY